MKAAVIREHGPQAAVLIEDIPAPQSGTGQVVVDVKAAALNHLDIWVRTTDRFDVAKPHVLGSDAAGVVREVGRGVTGWEAGDEVVVYCGLFCGRCEFCRAGQHSQCTTFGLLGATAPGTFAERLAVPAANLLPKPTLLSWAQTAALPVAYLTAWRMLVTRATLRPGETVLVHGVGGGAALAGLQIAKLLGAAVIATSSSDDKLRRASELGADHVLNYRDETDLASAVRDLTGGRGVDVALDTVGAATFGLDLQVLRRGGRVVLCGVTTGAEAQINLQTVYWNQLNILGSTCGTLDEFRLLLQACETGRLAPVIDATYPLDQAAEATARLESGEQFGKIVLAVNG